MAGLSLFPATQMNMALYALVKVVAWRKMSATISMIGV